MKGETDLLKMIKGMKPILNEGEYVFTTVKDISLIDRKHTLCEFKEKEGVTIIIEREKADELDLNYEYVAAWISLTIHSSLEAVGLTALFSSELARNGISSNIVAGYYHDHIFIDIKDAERTVKVLTNLSNNYK